MDKSHIKSIENQKTTLPFSDIYIGGAPSSILKSRWVTNACDQSISAFIVKSCFQLLPVTGGRHRGYRHMFYAGCFSCLQLHLINRKLAGSIKELACFLLVALLKAVLVSQKKSVFLRYMYLSWSVGLLTHMLLQWPGLVFPGWREQWEFHLIFLNSFQLAWLLYHAYSFCVSINHIATHLPPPCLFWCLPWGALCCSYHLRLFMYEHGRQRNPNYRSLQSEKCWVHHHVHWYSFTDSWN